jgi:hypothetical protein
VVVQQPRQGSDELLVFGLWEGASSSSWMSARSVSRRAGNDVPLGDGDDVAATALGVRRSFDEAIIGQCVDDADQIAAVDPVRLSVAWLGEPYSCSASGTWNRSYRLR